jgi:hypothetical protein
MLIMVTGSNQKVSESDSKLPKEIAVTSEGRRENVIT